MLVAQHASQLQDIPQGLLGGLIVFLVVMAVLYGLAKFFGSMFK